VRPHLRHLQHLLHLGWPRCSEHDPLANCSSVILVIVTTHLGKYHTIA
jgi:hypothetical protein